MTSRMPILQATLNPCHYASKPSHSRVIEPTEQKLAKSFSGWKDESLIYKLFCVLKNFMWDISWNMLRKHLKRKYLFTFVTRFYVIFNMHLITRLVAMKAEWKLPLLGHIKIK